MISEQKIYLGVNIDHVATLRQARGETYPCPVEAAKIAISAGANSITAHLREDRRHIQDRDIYDLKAVTGLVLNMEMAATDEMAEIACDVKPSYCCLVPEKREELTTEGGLDVIENIKLISRISNKLQDEGIKVSLFINADSLQVEAANELGVEMIELHTGQYANASQKKDEINRINKAAKEAHSFGLQVNAGHGLTVNNVAKIAAIPEIVELNIGHSIICRSLFVGLANAVKEIKDTMLDART